MFENTQQIVEDCWRWAGGTLKTFFYTECILVNNYSFKKLLMYFKKCLGRYRSIDIGWIKIINLEMLSHNEKKSGVERESVQTQ